VEKIIGKLFPKTNVVVPEPIHDIIDVVLVDGMMFGEDIKSHPRRQSSLTISTLQAIPSVPHHQYHT